MDDFEKKFPASPCRKKKIACSTNEIEKNSCTSASKKKKCCQAISSFQGDFTKSQQNCNHSSLAPFKLWSWLCFRMCNAFLAMHSLHSIANSGFKNLAKYSQNYPYQGQIKSFKPTSSSKIHNQNSCFITQIIKEQIKLQLFVNKSIFGKRLFLSRSTVGHDQVQFYLP